MVGGGSPNSYPISGPPWTHSEFIPSPKLNSSPLQKLSNPNRKGERLPSSIFSGGRAVKIAQENPPFWWYLPGKMGISMGQLLVSGRGPWSFWGVFFWSTNKNRTFEIFSQQSGGTPMGFIRRNNFHHVGFLYIVLREDVSKGLRLGVKGEG